jgi:hypothetical protein
MKKPLYDFATVYVRQPFPLGKGFYALTLTLTLTLGVLALLDSF